MGATILNGLQRFKFNSEFIFRIPTDIRIHGINMKYINWRTCSFFSHKKPITYVGFECKPVCSGRPKKNVFTSLTEFQIKIPH